MSITMLARLLLKGKYRYQDQTKKAITDVIEHYKNLKPELEKVTITKSNVRDLVVLRGTIPVHYRSNTYNIPVSIAIPHDYPYNPPLCQVCPTADMMVKVSEHVDQTGKVFLPYLADWNSERSDLLGVIQVMIILFGEKPPVYSKQPTQSQPPPAAMPTPPYPPYPTRFSGNTPYPPYPMAQPAPAYPGASTTASTAVTSSPSYPAYPGMPPHLARPNPAAGGPGSSDTITSEHIRMSLLTAAEDKLKKRAKEIQQQYMAEIDVLKRTRDDLTQGRKTLDNIVKTTEMNLVEAAKCKDNINAKIGQMNDCIAKLESENKDQMNIDECFGPIEPLYKQLFNAYVEESAIVDTIYYLNEGLKKEVIDLDIFLKHVRELSRRQFMSRALIKLCRQKAGLPS